VVFEMRERDFMARYIAEVWAEVRRVQVGVSKDGQIVSDEECSGIEQDVVRRAEAEDVPGIVRTVVR
jgi:hypothetical protein